MFYVNILTFCSKKVIFIFSLGLLNPIVWMEDMVIDYEEYRWNVLAVSVDHHN
jgi:hypothetical protein